MKPQIENVLERPEYRWILKEYHCRVANQEFTCSWHYHSEYELVLYRDPQGVFCGRYFAGDGSGDVGHNSLLLYGPGLPHMIAGRLSGDTEHDHHSIILWFRPQWIEALVDTMPELRTLLRTLRKANRGLAFSEQSAEQIFPLLNRLQEAQPHHQLLRVLQTLTILADDQQTHTLSVNPYGVHDLSHDADSSRRVEQARKFIEKYYHQPLKVADLCQALHISESSAYRLFERHFHESFSEHLRRFRVGKACELLLMSETSVAMVAEQTGFNNLSNFNRQFKVIKAMTPSQFRSHYRVH